MVSLVVHILLYYIEFIMILPEAIYGVFLSAPLLSFVHSDGKSVLEAVKYSEWSESLHSGSDIQLHDLRYSVRDPDFTEVGLCPKGIIIGV